jgi:hypothetical protein
MRLLRIIFVRGGQGFPQAGRLGHCPLSQTLSPNPLYLKLKGGWEGSLRGGRGALYKKPPGPPLKKLLPQSHNDFQAVELPRYLFILLFIPLKYFSFFSIPPDSRSNDGLRRVALKSKDTT